jgi:CHAT domain-containing protein
MVAAVSVVARRSPSPDLIVWVDTSGSLPSSALYSRRSAQEIVAPQISKSLYPDQSEIFIAQATAKREDATVLVYGLGYPTSWLLAANSRSARVIELPPKRQVEEDVDKYLRTVIDRPFGAAGEQYKAAGYELYQELTANAQPFLHGGRLIIVTDGELDKLPFEALMWRGARPHSDNSDDVTRFLIEDFEISYARSMLELQEPRRDPKRIDPKIVIFADPQLSQQTFPRLAHAADEAREVLRHFPLKRVSIYTGSRATKEAFEQATRTHPAMIHIATHGIIMSSDLGPALALAPGAQESDLLGSSEIAGMDLRADLVVLSACSTGLSREKDGKSSLSVGDAFRRAGARNVVESLWAIDDSTTPVFMDSFYEYTQKGESPSAALRRAKLQMLHSSGFHSHPYYWAAFVNLGPSGRSGSRDISASKTGFSKH